MWAKEAESRIDAYEQGKIKVIALAKVLEKYPNRIRASAGTARPTWLDRQLNQGALMSEHNLILYPVDPESTVVPSPKLVALFTDIGLIGRSIEKPGETSFRPGPSFYRLVTFHRSHRIITLVDGPEGLIPGSGRRFSIAVHYSDS